MLRTQSQTGSLDRWDPARARRGAHPDDRRRGSPRRDSRALARVLERRVLPRQSFAGHGRETTSFDGSSTCLEPFPIAVYVGFVDPVAPTASRQRFRELCPPSNVELDGGAARAEAVVRRRERPGLPRDPVARPRPLESSQRHADAALSMKRWNGCQPRQLMRAGTPSRAVKAWCPESTYKYRNLPAL